MIYEVIPIVHWYDTTHSLTRFYRRSSDVTICYFFGISKQKIYEVAFFVSVESREEICTCENENIFTQDKLFIENIL